MKAQDLRIGNYMLCYGHVRQVVEIGLNGFLATSQDGQSAHSFEHTMYSPIPLTEEWLIKFSFGTHSAGLFRKKIHDQQSRFLETILPGMRDFWDFVIIIEHKHKSDDTEVWITSLKYVHQLQNLYFALTGQELTVS